MIPFPHPRTEAFLETIDALVVAMDTFIASGPQSWIKSLSSYAPVWTYLMAEANGDTGHWARRADAMGDPETGVGIKAQQRLFPTANAPETSHPFAWASAHARLHASAHKEEMEHAARNAANALFLIPTFSRAFRMDVYAYPRGKRGQPSIALAINGVSLHNPEKESRPTPLQWTTMRARLLDFVERVALFDDAPNGVWAVGPEPEAPLTANGGWSTAGVRGAGVRGEHPLSVRGTGARDAQKRWCSVSQNAYGTRLVHAAGRAQALAMNAALEALDTGMLGQDDAHKRNPGTNPEQPRLAGLLSILP